MGLQWDSRDRDLPRGLTGHHPHPRRGARGRTGRGGTDRGTGQEGPGPVARGAPAARPGLEDPGAPRRFPLRETKRSRCRGGPAGGAGQGRGRPGRGTCGGPGGPPLPVEGDGAAARLALPVGAVGGGAADHHLRPPPPPPSAGRARPGPRPGPAALPYGKMAEPGHPGPPRRWGRGFCTAQHGGRHMAAAILAEVQPYGGVQVGKGGVRSRSLSLALAVQLAGRLPTSRSLRGRRAVKGVSE